MFVPLSFPQIFYTKSWNGSDKFMIEHIFLNNLKNSFLHIQQFKYVTLI